MYCINFEEGCRVKPCEISCQTCKGWVSKNKMPSPKATKPKPDVNTKELHRL
jgi:hypothetical protein